ncbi:MAG TPA: OmpA family protein, partial [Candidatus Krumholzibacteria bacterium]|nr:OmpA family protein [Candidatus Krumholzibacteria bacterium]
MATAFRAFGASPAGSFVDNTARASFQSGATADTISSNSVRTRVAPQYGWRLAPPGTVAAPAFSSTGAPGDTLYFQFTLTNLANAPDSASVSFALDATSTLAVSNVVFFRDANGNARFDPGEDDRAFLALGSGSSTPLDVAVVLPSAATGTAFVEVHAVSTADFSLSPAADISVLRVTSRNSSPVVIYFGPRGNPRALPGGDGSSDDETRVPVGIFDESVALDGEIENAGPTDSLQIFLAGAASLPAGSVLACTDSTGVAFPSSQPGRFTVGTLTSGERLPVRFVVSTPGTPVRASLAPRGVMQCVAQSLSDTLVTNATRFRLVAPALRDLRAMIGLDQTFRQATASVGDVASMVVTVVNRTDSIRVDNLLVTEAPPPSLDFSSGNGVTADGHTLVWNVGSLGPGESRSTTVRFVVNSRESKGWARVSGSADGHANSGDDVTAGPVVASIRIDNEEIGIEGVILGDVFVDENANNKRDAGEKGIPNASVYLESGEHAVTDSLGLFAIPHVFEGYRMVRLDESSLPPGLEFATPLASRDDSPRGNERLVHLIAPGMARVSFALRKAPPAMVDRAARVMCEESVSLTKQPHPKGVVLPSSYFALGRANLREGTGDELAPIAQFLKDYPGWSALVEGHTDSQPIHTARYPNNQVLSKARADAVRDKLVGMGVAPSRFLVVGYGDTRPVASNTTVDGRRYNRRVEISFIPPGYEGAVTAERVAAAVRDLSTQPDSLHAVVSWTMTTTSEEHHSGALRIDVPAVLGEAAVDVRMHDRPLAQAGGAFVFDDYGRDAPIECRVNFTIAMPDTAAIRQIAATLSLRDSTTAAPVARTSGSTWHSLNPDLHPHTVDAARTITIHPLQHGGGAGDPRTFDLTSWSERVPAPHVAEPPAAAPAPVTAASVDTTKALE